MFKQLLSKLKTFIDSIFNKSSEKDKEIEKINNSISKEDQEKRKFGAHYGSPIYFPTRSRKIKNKLHKKYYGR